MPMLYGEGERALVRLQEEIITKTNDLTLFAWEARQGESRDNSRQQKYRGILARSPAEFIDAGNILSVDGSRFDSDFSTGACEWMSAWIMPLNCRRNGSNGSNNEQKRLGIYLKKHGEGVYARVKPELLAICQPAHPRPRRSRSSASASTRSSLWAWIGTTSTP